MLKLLTADQFRSEAKEGGEPDGIVYRFATADPADVEGVARTKRFVFSDATIDHAGDSIDVKGWDLTVFNKNPVALFSHMSWQPPIGRASNVGVVGKQLVGDIEFATAEVYEFADTIYRLVDGGFLKATSVGFKPKEWTFTNDKDRPFGIDFKKQTLLEISVCPVPCNPNALSEARSMGIDTRGLVEWAEKVLDSGDTVFLPKNELETLRSQAGAPNRRFYLQVPRDFTAEQAKRVGEQFHAWKADEDRLLVVPEGVEVRIIGGERRKSGDWTCGAAHDLPIDDSGEWDGAAAEASIFEHAGGDDFDPDVAKKGFLAYDASAPKLRGSYKLPFARVVDGEMKAVAEGIRAAASRLPQADVPESVQETARGVLDAYEAKMGGKTVSEILVRIKAEIDTEDFKALEALIAKAGRRVSAATKAKLQEAMGHHDAMGKCIQSLMEDPDEGDDDPAGDPDEIHDEGLTNQPPGTVVAESDEHLSPEERRLKEVRALRETLPTND